MNDSNGSSLAVSNIQQDNGDLFFVNAGNNIMAIANSNNNSVLDIFGFGVMGMEGVCEAQ